MLGRGGLVDRSINTWVQLQLQCCVECESEILYGTVRSNAEK